MLKFQVFNKNTVCLRLVKLLLVVQDLRRNKTATSEYVCLGEIIMCFFFSRSISV